MMRDLGFVVLLIVLAGCAQGFMRTPGDDGYIENEKARCAARGEHAVESFNAPTNSYAVKCSKVPDDN